MPAPLAWIHDELGRGVGLPSVLGGIPLDELGATGYGLAVCAETLGEAGLLEAEHALHRRGILSVPDVIANAGGIICASVEYRGGDRDDAFAAIRSKIRSSTWRCSNGSAPATMSRDEKSSGWRSNGSPRPSHTGGGSDTTVASW